MAQDASNFNPTDEELMKALVYKVMGVPVPSHDYIRAADLYGEAEPWEIFGDAGESRNLYLFTKLKKYGKMTDPQRFSRRVGRGKWAGRAHNITRIGDDFMGYKKSFRYVPRKKGSGDNNEDQNYSWHMDEYSLVEDWPVPKEYKDYVICVLSKIAAEKVGSLSGKGRDQGPDVGSGLDRDDRRGILIQG